MHVIGLTGSIGSGKSTVSKMLGELGAEIINADLVGHRVYEPGTPGWQQVTGAFGTSVIAEDGTIDRKKLGALVFADRAALERLNAIVHPLIAEAVQKEIRERRDAKGARAIVVEAAVLIEANWVALVDEVWVVTATPEAVVQRVGKERGLPAAQIAARMAAQLSDQERRRHADVIIENTGSIEDLRKRVTAAWERLAKR